MTLKKSNQMIHKGFWNVWAFFKRKTNDNVKIFYKRELQVKIKRFILCE